MSSRRAQQHIEAERRQLERAQYAKDETQHSAARTLDAYVRVYEDLYGTTPQITYSRGWFHVQQGKKQYGYRAAEITKMTGVLMARLHQKQMNEQIDHPELLNEKE